MPQDLLSSSGASDTHRLAGRRIIIMLGPLVLGGSERQALLLARYLKEEQHADIHVWGTEHGRVSSLCEEYGIPWHIIPCPWAGRRFELLNNLRKFAQRLRHARPEVILPYMSLPSFACNFVWKWTGARFCVWNQRDHGLTRFVSRYEGRAVKNTPVFIANSKYIASYLTEELGADSQRVRIVPNGIELAPPEMNPSEWRKSLKVDESTLLACMVANLHQDKDQATLLKSWRHVIDRWTLPEKPVLLLAGRFDTTHEALKALAFDLRLDESVRFLGAVKDVSGLLRTIDLGVFSSKSEGSPNGVLECMASGLALVCTDIPPLREAMPPDQYPFLIPAADHEGFAEKILDLFANQELRAQLGTRNRQQAAAFFSKEKMCETMRDLIEDGLSD